MSTVVFGKYIVPLFDELNETFKRSYDKPSYINVINMYIRVGFFYLFIQGFKVDSLEKNGKFCAV